MRGAGAGLDTGGRATSGLGWETGASLADGADAGAAGAGVGAATGVEAEVLA